MSTYRIAAFSALAAIAGSEAKACTILVDARTGMILRQHGACDRRSSPVSTFKVALSLMGYDAGLLKDESNPAWPYKPEFNAWNDAWKKTTTPRSWLADSVVWYSQVLARELGAQRFRRYVQALDYGNRDISGDRGKNNGLTHAWLGSSLQISPREQIVFLRKLLSREHPVSAHAQERTRAIIPAFSAPGGWSVRGKTGSGFQTDTSGKPDRSRQFGWFVGWAEKEDRTILFATLIHDERKEPGPAGFRARDRLLADLPALAEN